MRICEYYNNLHSLHYYSDVFLIYIMYFEVCLMLRIMDKPKCELYEDKLIGNFTRKEILV